MPLTNRDVLAWFSEEDPADCDQCGEHMAVTLPDVRASFCLACGAVTVNGTASPFRTDRYPISYQERSNSDKTRLSIRRHS